MSNPLQDKLNALFTAVVDELLEQVKAKGECKPQTLAVAVKLLKDNGIECLPEANKSLQELKSILGDEAFTGPDNLQ